MLPPLLVLVGIVAVAWASGAAMPFPNMIAWQLQDETIAIGLKTRDDMFRYRVEDLRIQQPEFVVLGSSTSEALRPNLMEDATLYYNAGVGGARINEQIAILNSMPDTYSPSLILLPIDVWRVNRRDVRRDVSGWYVPYSEFRSLHWAIQRVRQGTIDHIQQLLSNHKMQELPVLSDRQLQLLGYDPRLLFLRDGDRLRAFPRSCCIADTAEDEELRTGAYKRFLGIDIPVNRILITDDMRNGVFADELLEDIHAILQYAQDHDSVVIGYVSPIMPVIYQQVDNHSCYQTYSLVTQEMAMQFQNFDMLFVDLLDPSLVQLSDAHFTDELHLTDLGGTLLYRLLVETFPDLLESYSSLEHLDTLIADYTHITPEEVAAYATTERERLLALGTIPTDVCPSQVES